MGELETAVGEEDETAGELERALLDDESSGEDVKDDESTGLLVTAGADEDELLELLGAGDELLEADELTVGELE